MYDIQQYIDDPEIICEEILKIQNCNGATPIIYAPGFSTFSRVIVALYEGGISEFILASDLSEQRSQLEKCMNGYYSKNGIAELEVIKTLSEQEAQLKDELKYTTIGVVGTANRIGTTTQALHITKYLIAKGYTACYVHINNTDYIKDLQEWWGAEIQDNFIGKVVYEGIDHFYKTEHLTEIKNLDMTFMCMTTVRLQTISTENLSLKEISKYMFWDGNRQKCKRLLNFFKAKFMQTANIFFLLGTNYLKKILKELWENVKIAQSYQHAALNLINYMM